MTSADFKDHFQEHGFAVVPGVLEESDFTEVRHEYAEALDSLADTWRAEGRLDGGLEFRGRDFESQLLGLAALPSFDGTLLGDLDITLPHMPFTMLQATSRLHLGSAVLGLLRNSKILDTVCQLVGDEIRASPNQHVRLKLPAKGQKTFEGRHGETMHAPTLWHQDAMTQMPQSDATDLITCWVPLMDVNADHGCLLVVPDRHREDSLLPWPMDTATTQQLEAAAVPLPVSKGDLVLLHKRTPHGSTLNRSGNLRWSFDFRFYPAHEPTDRPWFPSVTVRSRAHPELASTGAEAWYQDWMDARDMLVREGQIVPGRREFAQLVAQSLMTRWESGDYPTLPNS